jgi:hypothetical protein
MMNAQTLVDVGINKVIPTCSFINRLLTTLLVHHSFLVGFSKFQFPWDGELS